MEELSILKSIEMFRDSFYDGLRLMHANQKELSDKINKVNDKIDRVNDMIMVDFRDFGVRLKVCEVKIDKIEEDIRILNKKSRSKTGFFFSFLKNFFLRR